MQLATLVAKMDEVRAAVDEMGGDAGYFEEDTFEPLGRAKSGKAKAKAKKGKGKARASSSDEDDEEDEDERNSFLDSDSDGDDVGAGNE